MKVFTMTHCKTVLLFFFNESSRNRDKDVRNFYKNISIRMTEISGMRRFDFYTYVHRCI